MTLPQTDPPGERPKARWLKDAAELPAKAASPEGGFRVEPRSVVPARTVLAPRTGLAPRTDLSPRASSEPRPAPDPVEEPPEGD